MDEYESTRISLIQLALGWSSTFTLGENALTTDCTRLVHLWDPPCWSPNSTYFYLEIPLLFVLQIYTPKRHNLHRSYQSRGRLPWICAIFRVLYECPFPLFKARQRIISCLRNMRHIWSVESRTLFLSCFIWFSKTVQFGSSILTLEDPDKRGGCQELSWWSPTREYWNKTSRHARWSHNSLAALERGACARCSVA